MWKCKGPRPAKKTLKSKGGELKWATLSRPSESTVVHRVVLVQTWQKRSMQQSPERPDKRWHCDTLGEMVFLTDQRWVNQISTGGKKNLARLPPETKSTSDRRWNNGAFTRQHRIVSSQTCPSRHLKQGTKSIKHHWKKLINWSTSKFWILLFRRYYWEWKGKHNWCVRWDT